MQCTPWGPEHLDLASMSMDGGGTSHSLILLDCPDTWPCVFRDSLGQGGMSSPPSSSCRLCGGPSPSSSPSLPLFSLSFFLSLSLDRSPLRSVQGPRQGGPHLVRYRGLPHTWGPPHLVGPLLFAWVLHTAVVLHDGQKIPTKIKTKN